MLVKISVRISSTLSRTLFFALYLQAVSNYNQSNIFDSYWAIENIIGTGIFQPVDVGLNQWVIKHCLKQHQMQFLVDLHQQQIKNGLTPEQVKFTTSLPVLRDASVAASVDVYDFMTGALGCDLVKKVDSNSKLTSW
jgi:hypothetical protein